MVNYKKTRYTALLLFCSMVFCYNLSGQYKLLKDINAVEGSASSSPGEMVQMGEYFYFSAMDNVHGTELWRSDGTEMGTSLVKDISKGKESSSPIFPKVLDGKLYFFADDGIHGIELWVSDGTADGTNIVKDINSGSQDSTPSRFMELDGILIFAADNGSIGKELWKTDGSSEGTILIRDINPGENGASISIWTKANAGGLIFFSADDGVNGRELWKSDGSELGTSMVKNVRLEPGDSRPWWLTGVGDLLYLVLDDGINGREVWKSDGTEAGTVMVKDINEGGSSSLPTDFTEYLGIVYFRARGNGVTSLWRTDGTEDGTFDVITRDLDPDLGPSKITSLSDGIYFAGRVGLNEYGLWKSDGTDSGTLLINRINETGDALGGGVIFSATYFIELAGNVFFVADNGTQGRELWKTDGTNEGTILLKDIYSGAEQSSINNLMKFKDNIYFMANDRINGAELWKTDGTEIGTTLVKNINEGTGGASPSFFAKIGGITLFDADDGVHGRELWRSDGTSVGTMMVKDVNPNTASSSPKNLTEIDGELYFTADDGIQGIELWKSDGTSDGTILVKDIQVGSLGSNPLRLFKALGELYFIADDGINGIELWKSDGTSVGTTMVKNIHESDDAFSIYFSSQERFAEVDGVLYFMASNTIYRQELWRSDGTEEGTYLLKDIAQPYGSNPRGLINISGTLFFSASDGINGTELWKSDGTELGTIMVKDINLTGDSHPNFLTSKSGTLYFTANDGVHGYELWRSDGTESGTVLVKDIDPGTSTSSSYGYVFEAVEDGISFRVNDGVHGSELWKSDGTEEGTFLIKDNPLSLSYSNVTEAIVSQSGILYFIASDGVGANFLNREIWRSNGTEEGTYILPSFEGGSTSDAFFINDGLIYVVRSSVQYGSEIFTITDKSLQSIDFSSLANKIYGESSFSLDASASSNNTVTLMSSDETIAEVSGLEVSIVGAGSVTITAEQSGDEDYYPAASIEKVLVVEKADLKAKADNKEKNYGSTNPELSVSYEGFVYEDGYTVLDQAPVIALQTDETSSVGEYEISLSGGEDNNYNIIEVLPGTLTINKASLVAKAEDKEKTYGDSNPELTVTYEGFVNDENPNVLDSTPLAETFANQDSDVGEYEISLSDGEDDNYDITEVKSGTLTISKASLVATVDSNEKSYGAENPDFSFSYEGFVNEESEEVLDVKPLAETSADKTSDVGSYQITLTEVEDNNYDITEVKAGTLTVNKAALIAKADNKEKVYGDETPDLTISYEGFVNDESADVLDTPPTAETVVDQSSGSGEYEITLTDGEDNNYNISEVKAGTLTINKAALTAKADDKGKVYGDENPDLTVRYEGFVNDESVDVLDTPPTAETGVGQSSGAGEYGITLTDGEDTNYNFEKVTGTLTVEKAGLTATAENKTKARLEPNPELTIAYEGFVNGDNEENITKPTATTVADENSAAGGYDIELTGGDADNYRITLVNGVLTVEEILGIEDLQYKVKVYPNPAQHYLKIDVNSNVQLSISSLNGKLVLSQSIIKGQSANLRNLKSGHYLIQLWDGKKMIYNGKLIKKD